LNKPKNNIKVNFKIKNCFSLLYQQLCESKIFWWKLTQYRKKFIISNLDADDTSWQKCYRNSDYFFLFEKGLIYVKRNGLQTETEKRSVCRYLSLQKECLWINAFQTIFCLLRQNIKKDRLWHFVQFWF
jgi:hypothetical protein